MSANGVRECVAQGAALGRTDLEAWQRAAVVAEARRWIGTPYHSEAAALGAGVDCGMILVRTFVDTGLIEPFDPRPYAADFMMHSAEERYVGLVQRFAARELDLAAEPPRPGDVVVWKHGRSFSHGALVTGRPGTLSGWPWVVHAFAGGQVVEEIDTTGADLMRLGPGRRPMRAFSYWGR